MKKFVDVILPLPLPRYFTYSLPEEWADEVQMGCRVVVPFGRKKYYTAIVRNVHYCEPADYEVKKYLHYWMPIRFYCRNNLSFGSGWQIIISVHKAMFIRLLCLPA